MKKKLALLLATAMICSTLFTGCGDSAAENSEDASTSAVEDSAEDIETDAELPKVVCLLNGNLGDKSFFDSANLGMQKIEEELGCETKVIEMGFDNTVWESTLYEVSDEDYDIIVVGTYQMQELLSEVALEYPEKKYIIFDSNVAYAEADYSNVYSISFKQNEASYLAGVVAAMLADDENAEYSTGQNIIGAVSAMDIPVLNDFLVGYIQGATDVVPETKVAVSYIGNFDDTAKAKDLAAAQFDIGSSVCLNVASQAGLGMIEAAAEDQRFAIGVDSDQAEALEATKAQQSAVIVTSVLKNVDEVLLQSVRKHIEGTLPYGTEETLGMEENAVGIAINDYYGNLTTQEIKDKVTELQQKIQNGEIEVLSAFTMTDDEIADLKASVAP